MIYDVSNDHDGKLVNLHHALNKEKKLSPTVCIHVENVNDHSGNLVIAHWRLKKRKKQFHGFVELVPNHFANDGIYIIATHHMVVQEIGINGLSVHSLKPHLVAHHVNNKVILYVHDAEYVCVLSVLTFHNTQSHRSTI